MTPCSSPSTRPLGWSGCPTDVKCCSPTPLVSSRSFPPTWWRLSRRPSKKCRRLTSCCTCSTLPDTTAAIRWRRCTKRCRTWARWKNRSCWPSTRSINCDRRRLRRFSLKTGRRTAPSCRSRPYAKRGWKPWARRLLRHFPVRWCASRCCCRTPRTLGRRNFTPRGTSSRSTTVPTGSRCEGPYRAGCWRNSIAFESPPRTGLPSGLAEQAHERHHLALELGGGAVDRFVAVVLRLQPHPVGLAKQPLNGGGGLVGLLVLHPGHDDAAIGRVFPGTHHDKIAGEDAGILHAVAADLEGEGIVAANQLLAQHEMVVDIFFGKDRLSGRDPAHQWYRDYLAELGLQLVDVDDFDGAGLGGIPANVSLALQRVEVVLHRGAGGEPDRLTDFTDRGRVAADLLTKPKVLQDFPLPAGQRFRHLDPSLVRRSRWPGADHLAPSAVPNGASREGRGGVLRPRSSHRSTAIWVPTSVDFARRRGARDPTSLCKTGAS